MKMKKIKPVYSYILLVFILSFFGSMIGWHELYLSNLVNSANLTDITIVVSSGEVSESRIVAGAIQRKLLCHLQDGQADIHVIMTPPPFPKENYALGEEILVYPCSDNRFITKNMVKRGHSVLRCGNVGFTKVFITSVFLNFLGVIIIIYSGLRRKHRSRYSELRKSLLRESEIETASLSNSERLIWLAEHLNEYIGRAAGFARIDGASINNVIDGDLGSMLFVAEDVINSQVSWDSLSANINEQWAEVEQLLGGLKKYSDVFDELEKKVKELMASLEQEMQD